MPHPGRGFAHAQRVGRFAVRELLEVAHEKDLAIGLLELVQGFAKPALELLAKGGGRGSQARIPKLAGEVDRRMVREPSRQRLLAVKAPARGPTMSAVLVDHVVASDLAKPEVKRHQRVTKIFAEPLVRLEEHFLNDVARVHPTPECVIEPETDHSSKRLAMALPERIRCVSALALDA
jgi:hypothetical protein